MNTENNGNHEKKDNKTRVGTSSTGSAGSARSAMSGWSWKSGRSLRSLASTKSMRSMRRKVTGMRKGLQTCIPDAKDFIGREVDVPRYDYNHTFNDYSSSINDNNSVSNDDKITSEKTTFRGRFHQYLQKQDPESRDRIQQSAALDSSSRSETPQSKSPHLRVVSENEMEHNDESEINPDVARESSENEYDLDDSLSYLVVKRFFVSPDGGCRKNNQELNEEVNDKLEFLAGTRTPSFNVMTHANQNYSDNSTLAKRSSMRISWEDIQNANANLNTDSSINNDDTGNENNESGDDEVVTTSESKLQSERKVVSFGDLSESSLGDASDAASAKPKGILTVKSSKTRSSKWTSVRSAKAIGVLVRNMSIRDSLAQPEAYERDGSNKGGIPLYSMTSVVSVTHDFNEFVRYERVKEWLKHFKTCDPRFRILKFFNDVAQEGATGHSVNFRRDHISPLLKYFSRSAVFTVWRPTSKDAIRRMMLGHGVGKGLDIKGKSAKRGRLSAFVPFLQIHDEEDKTKVRTLRKNGTIRVFFDNEQDRDQVVKNLNEVAIEMVEVVREAKQIVSDNSNGVGQYDEDTVEHALKRLTLDMEDTTITNIDLYASSGRYGMVVQERLFWEGMVVRQNIERKPGSRNDTGRTSMPSFQEMNFDSVRKTKNSIPGGHTRAVIMQLSTPPGEKEKGENGNYDPMSPLDLVMAYEENDPDKGLQRVVPCVSDFDCFLFGSRGVKYEEQVPEEQLDILKWMIKQTEGVLETPNGESWTARWLEVLKESLTKQGFNPKIPTGGFSDPKTEFIFKFAINRLSITGCVRHGAECFNYSFPQELDEQLLVISDDLPDKYKGCSWVYVDQHDLQEILKYKIRSGFTFPLNPKWILCDPGWKLVYDTLMASEKANVQDSLRCWYPPESGIRESIDRISKNNPNGFERIRDNDCRNSRASSYSDGTSAMDLARQQFKYFLTFQRARRRLKAILLLNRMLDSVRQKRRENGMEHDQPSAINDLGKKNVLDSEEEQDLVTPDLQSALD